MSVDQIITIALAMVGSLGGAFMGVKIAQARLEEKVRRIEAEIGDHDHGIRGRLHEHAKFLQRHEMELETLKRWKDQK